MRCTCTAGNLNSPLEGNKKNGNYCIVPRCSVTFWTHPEIIPVGNFSDNGSNQSINQAYTFIVSLYNHKFVPIDFFTGAGLRWPNTTGQCVNLQSMPIKRGYAQRWSMEKGRKVYTARSLLSRFSSGSYPSPHAQSPSLRRLESAANMRSYTSPATAPPTIGPIQ